MDKSKKIFKKIIAFGKSKYGKMTLFFGFYFFFFLFLASHIQINDTINQPKPPVELDTFYIDGLIDDNYHYTYTVLENDKEYTFMGLINEKNAQIEIHKYHYFLNLYNIKQLVKHSKYLSKEKDSQQIIFNYEITNDELYELCLDELDFSLPSDINQLTNQIVVYTDENYLVTMVKLQLDNYLQGIDGGRKLTITLKYTKGSTE